jgi:uncharacterized protein
MLLRDDIANQIKIALGRSPICALLGPRQCGKTTLARRIAEGSPSHFFDLESPRDLLRLTNPELALEKLQGLIVIEWGQRSRINI